MILISPKALGLTMLQSNTVTTFFFNRYDFCSNSEESFILDPDSNVGNRIESITQRTAVVEGKNKVFFGKISIGIFTLKTHTQFPVLGLLQPEVIKMLNKNSERRKYWDMSSWDRPWARSNSSILPLTTRPKAVRTRSSQKRWNCPLLPTSVLLNPWGILEYSPNSYIWISGVEPRVHKAPRRVTRTENHCHTQSGVMIRKS